MINYSYFKSQSKLQILNGRLRIFIQNFYEYK